MLCTTAQHNTLYFKTLFRIPFRANVSDLELNCVCILYILRRQSYNHTLFRTESLKITDKLFRAKKPRAEPYAVQRNVPVGSYKEVPPPPPAFPSCGYIHISSIQYLGLILLRMVPIFCNRDLKVS